MTHTTPVRRLAAAVAPAALAAGLAMVAFAPTAAQTSPVSQAKTASGAPGAPKAIKHLDPAAARAMARAAGHKTHGGISKDKSESRDARFRSLPHFSSAFTYKGTTYPYTMLGFSPSSGESARLKTVIVPLRLEYKGFEQDVTFEPDFAVRNILRSPIYNETRWESGEVAQFTDAFQRVTFWNQMDRQRRWHTRLARPTVTRPVTIQVWPSFGDLFAIDAAGTMLGTINIDVLDSQIHTIIQLAGIQPDETPVFITQNAFADVALGYHDAFTVANDDGSETLQTLIFSSWLDPALVGDLLGDISTLNHEVAEWYDDPFVNNIVPLWAFPPKNNVCGDNPFLEVGDPPGNGPDFDLFPTTPVTMNGFTYHLQQLTTLQWFSREVPSSALNGWYSFPDPTQIVTPSVDCP